jgi:hypothetical protein
MPVTGASCGGDSQHNLQSASAQTEAEIAGMVGQEVMASYFRVSSAIRSGSPA